MKWYWLFYDSSELADYELEYDAAENQTTTEQPETTTPGGPDTTPTGQTPSGPTTIAPTTTTTPNSASQSVVHFAAFVSAVIVAYKF